MKVGAFDFYLHIFRAPKLWITEHTCSGVQVPLTTTSPRRMDNADP